MAKNQGADPKLIVAVQMLSIGLILLILAGVVLWLSPVGRMDSFIRLTFLLSMGSILLVGGGFAVAGAIRYRRARRP
jgi:hypothetical protein